MQVILLSYYEFIFKITELQMVCIHRKWSKMKIPEEFLELI